MLHDEQPMAIRQNAIRARHDANMPSAPVVSVIMPAYNVSQYIGAAIDSVLAQTFTDYEIIIVNDGSSDTVQLELAIAPYRERVIYMTQENRGCGAARNAALRAARGRYAALLDCDDIWEPEYLSVQVGILDRDPTVDVVYANALIIGDVPDAGRLFMDVNPSDGDVTLESLISARCTVMVSVTARRESLIRAGMFDESLRSAEDFDLWLRIVESGGRIVYHRKQLVRYRRRHGSLSSDPLWMHQNALLVFDKLERTVQLSDREHAALRRQRAQVRAMVQLWTGKRALAHGDIATAIRTLSEANSVLNSAKLRLVLLGLRTAPQLVHRSFSVRERLRTGRPRAARETNARHS